jgi:hypothetical protein
MRSGSSVAKRFGRASSTEAGVIAQPELMASRCVEYVTAAA